MSRSTYSIAGAQLGTSLLWTAFITWPLMAPVQMMCARIGMVTGRGIAGALRDHGVPGHRADPAEENPEQQSGNASRGEASGQVNKFNPASKGRASTLTELE